MAPNAGRRSLSRWRTTDARGRKVTQLDPATMHLLRRTDRIAADELAAIVDTIDPASRRRLKLAIWLLVAIVVLTFGGLAIRIILEGGGAWGDLVSTLTNPVFVFVVVVPGLSIGVLAPIIGLRRQSRRRARQAMLHHHRCPHCGYDLEELPIDASDGATICPECGCAWLIP